ncbi:hypothetical protein [Paeniglutamicibacter terrestris]|uniref:Uncharacterized protein n=1 Tax=Paeniglutamicibacter terrestris TaxID=2723403 RepID=A0ABX1G1D4_9MICC|nr:hypothetical protein [Paeniglutamicibacter terrestris]NKG19808.1 hypothetical protein [Paeniglutamicibacter terrestris]
MTEWISVIIAGLTFLTAAIALGYAKSQITESKASRKQVDDIELKKAEPFVVAHMEQGAAAYVQDFVIKNYGQTPAYDVVVKSNPSLMRSASATGSEVELVAIPKIIPYLAPGQEWRTLWDVVHSRVKNPALTEAHDVTVSFKGTDGTDLKSTAILDWGLMKSKRFLQIYGMHDLAKAMRDINKRTKKWTDFDGEFGVLVRSGAKKDKKWRKEMMRLHALNEQTTEFEERGSADRANDGSTGV